MKKLFCVILLLPLFHVSCLAEGIGEETARITGIYQVEEELPEEERTVSGELRLDGTYDTSGALSRLWDRFINACKKAIRGELGFAVKLTLISLLCLFSAVLCADKRVPQSMELAACFIGILLLAGDMNSMIQEVNASLYRLSDYGKAAFPVFYSAVAASGAAVSASVKYASVSFAATLYMELAQGIVLPLIYAFLSFSVCSCVCENAILSATCRFVKWCSVTSMTLLTAGFCTYIGLSGVISGSADAAAVKAAKTVISTALPVVGGILSDSASAILSAAGMIKNSAGVFCLIAICALCSGPFAILSVKMLLLKAAAAVSAAACGGRYSRLLDSAGAAMAMLLGMVGSFGIVLFYSFMSGIRATVQG